MMIARLRMIVLTLVATAGLTSVPARADFGIVIGEGKVQPVPIAITNMVGQSPQESQVGRDISSVVAADLERSGLFKPIDQKAFIQSLDSLQVQPRFADWKAINAQGLLSGNIRRTDDGQIRVEFRLWDVYGENQMVGLAPRRPYDRRHHL